jgi:hypothetical protein
MEINTQIHKVLDLGANPNPGAGPAPLQEGVASTRVSMFRPVLVSYMILSYHCAHSLMQGLRGARSEPQDANLPEDVVRRKVNRLPNKNTHAIESRSSGEVEVEGEITPPPLSSLRISPPPLGDIVSQQVGATVSERQLKQTQIGTKSSTDSPRHLHLLLVTSDQQEGDEYSVCINGDDPPFRHFVGPSGFDGIPGRYGSDSGGILVESRRGGACAQDPLWSLSTGVLSVCVYVCVCGCLPLT